VRVCCVRQHIPLGLVRNLRGLDLRNNLAKGSDAVVADRRRGDAEGVEVLAHRHQLQLVDEIARADGALVLESRGKELQALGPLEGLHPRHIADVVEVGDIMRKLEISLVDLVRTLVIVVAPVLSALPGVLLALLLRLNVRAGEGAG